MSTRNKSDRMAWFKEDAGAAITNTTGLPLVHVGILSRLKWIYWTSGNLNRPGFRGGRLALVRP